ncbi:MAG: hypothetical protein KatS3mg094_517 [Candidatus Parcubacteria bacterium]|nr:MAG: hypothetical protein KatS3mg094_517 [Candidatus Parcubacteria bacterium]
MNKYFKKLSLILLILITFYTLIFIKQIYSQNNIPICSSPNNLLILPGNWEGNRIVMTSATGSLGLTDLSLSTSSSGNILNTSNTWLILNKGLILSGPSYGFNNAGAIYFRDLSEARTISSGGNTRNSYSEFIIYVPTTTNNLVFFYKNASETSSGTVLTISTSGDIISSGNIISSGRQGVITNNLFSLNNISIGTSSALDKLYLYATSDQYINLQSANRGNLKIGSLFSNSEAVIRFKEILKIFYSNNSLPVLTINNNERVGINTSTPYSTLDVRGDIRASQDIITNGRFCLGSNCITNWPSAGGNIWGSGSDNYIPLWTGVNNLVNSIIKQTLSGATRTIEVINGSIIANKFCFKTDNNDLSCISSWPSRPAVAHFYRYIVGHEYWENFLTNLINSEPNVSGIDPYIRPRNGNYNENIGKGYPYLSLHDIINRIGIDPDNQFATKWFILGYSYRQPYTNVPTALFIEEGDNINPWKRYTKTSSSPGGLNPNNSSDVLVYCHYNAPSGAIYTTSNKQECDQIRNGNLQGYSIRSYTYAEKNYDIRGYVALDLRLEPANQRTVCTKRDYLDSISIASWGNTSVINLRINDYRYPNLNNDPCVDISNRRPNLHSVIMGRFRVRPYPTSNTASSDYIPQTSIASFLNNNNTDFKVVIKSLGVVELRNY